MPGYRIQTPPDLVAECRRLYEETDTSVQEIANRMGVGRSTLHYRIIDWNWTKRRPSWSSPIAAIPAVGTDLTAAPAPATAIAEPCVIAVADRAMLADEPPLLFATRMQRIIDGELAVIERTLKVLGPNSSAEADRTMRTLATVSRTVQEIIATAEGQTSKHEAHDDPVPGDIDEFRIALAERIEAFVAKRRSADDGGVSADTSERAME
jgi:hypothetical protein